MRAVLNADAAYRIWAATYDSDPNPVLAVEQRILGEKIRFAPGMRVLDLATGTGRWLVYARSRGAEAFGADLSPEMLVQASRKPGARGRLAQATLSALPFPDNFADLAICSFALGYLPALNSAFREMARTSRSVVVSDLHPEAVRAGWIRGFRQGETHYEAANQLHSSRLLDDCARKAELTLAWRCEARFGEPERRIFELAGKPDAFEAARRVPAVLISCWARA